MSALNRHGDESVIMPVYERIKKILARKRTVEQLPKSELMEGMELLKKLGSNNENVMELFKWIKTKKWHYLFDQEKNWLESNL